ncbi:MAG: DUF2231 domain-containing protein [Fimbriimonas sp.]|nr:DUF2231 domain-containing protein [Fimbriimonas sp.]
MTFSPTPPPRATSALLRLSFVFCLVALATVGQARPPFFQLYKEYYKLDPNSPNGKAGCKNCHSEGTRRNPYGKALAQLVNASPDNKLTIDMLKQVEGQDSDGDGWSNGDEIKNGYLPGDPANHPPGKPGDPIVPATKSSSGTSADGSKSGGLIPTHAFHPALVHFPIALFLFGVVLELFGLKNRNEELRKASLWNFYGALCSLIVVIPTGVAAWLMTGRKLEGTLLIHLILGVSSALLILASTLTRQGAGKDKKVYFALLVLCALCICATGYFGGELVYG